MTVPRRPLTVAAALAVASFLAAGCGSESASPSGRPTSVRSSAGETEEAQGNRAKGLLEKIHPDSPEFVESGMERVRDGVHSRSSLAKGKTYKVAVACVGTGAVDMKVGEKGAESIPCDGVSVSRRVEDSPEELPVDITAASGATGMVAWQITAASS